MRKWVSTSAKSVLLTAGFVALGSGVAFADSQAVTSGNGSLLGGNQAVVNGDVPVNVSGNAIGAVLGTAGASSTDTGAAVVDHQHGPDAATSGNGSAIGGNQLVVDGEIPVNVSGNAIAAVAGIAGASTTDTGAAVVEHQHGHRHHHHSPDAATSGNGSLLGGNQAVVDLDVPVNVAGNAISAVGGVAGAAATDTGALVHDGHGHGHGHREHHSAPAEYTAMDLVHEAAENATILPLPDTSGVNAGVLRQSAPREHQSAPREHQSIATSGNGSLVGGNQAVVDLDVPVNVAGNAIGAVGGVAGAASTDTGALVLEGEEHVVTSGNGSAVGGNQLVADGEVPVNVSGNAIAAVASLAGASSTGDGAAVVHQSAPEAQSSALDALPLVQELPEIPVSDMLPVEYEVSETTRQAVEQHAPEHADQLPESAPVGVADPVNELLGAAGVGL